MTRIIPLGQTRSMFGHGQTSRQLVESPSMIDAELLVEIRRENLRTLINESGNNRVFAEKVGKSEAQISHLAGLGAVKVIGEKLAREFEEKTGKPRGWMDRVHGVSDNILAKVMEYVDYYSQEFGYKLDDQTRNELVSLCYKLTAQHDVDKDMLRKIVKLVQHR